MKIKDIQISNYKVFHDLQLDFGQKSAVLFGVNGTGKSTVLSAINYIFRVFLNQMNPVQSKAFEKFTDDMITASNDQLSIHATVHLKDYYLLARFFKKSVKNTRTSEPTYPKANYSLFRDKFKELYLSSDQEGMPIFVHYGTNRAVLDIPDRIRGKHNFDKVSALERAIDLQLDFRTFFEWYRDREADEVLRARECGDYSYTDPALKHVRRAIETMIGGVSDLQVKRNPVRMIVLKAGKEIRVDMLSDGEKCTLALLGDLARRLILANPSADNPLEGNGIVLIDEIELHMHPAWQRRILKVLREVFPNIQFIVTTHSPQVLGEAGEEYRIFSLGLDEEGNGILAEEINRMDGYDSNLILEDYMGTPSESETKKKLVKDANAAIRKGMYEEADLQLEKLKELAGEDDEEYILAQAYLKRRMLR